MCGCLTDKDLLVGNGSIQMQREMLMPMSLNLVVSL